MKAAAEGMTAGEWLDGYQAVAQAPVEFICGERSRYIDGHRIVGSWSDPWWMYDPERGWAVARRWKNREQQVWDRSGGLVTFAARNEVVIDPQLSVPVAGRA